MKISQILENAKSFLITEEESEKFPEYTISRKTYYICVAAQRYVKSVCHKLTHDDDVLELVYPVSCFIEQKIADFKCESYSALPNKIAKELLGMSEQDQLTRALKQKARHIWVDQLIAELKKNPTRDLDIDIESYLA